jgi:hypothetical protein
MTLRHSTELFFAGRYDAATKRLQLLKSAGYVSDRWKRVGDRSVLYLTKKAFDHLIAQGALHDYPAMTSEQFLKRVDVKDATIAHELQVMDVRVALTKAIEASARYTVGEFTTWPLLSQFPAHHPVTAARLIVQPDGFLRVTDRDGSQAFNFFLELDRSTESQHVLAERVMCYREFCATGGFAQRCGATREQARQHPFRVLVVLQNAERRNNTAERLMNCSPPVKFQAWLSTFDEVMRDPLGPGWVSPLDYQRATAGTEYEPARRRQLTTYVRRSPREQLVEERILKRTLFEDVPARATQRPSETRQVAAKRAFEHTSRKSDPSLDRSC